MKWAPASSQLELRFELERAELYRTMPLTRVGTQIFGGISPDLEPDSPTLRMWRVGLMAMCLYDPRQHDYVNWERAIVHLYRLQPSTITVMLAELDEQRALAEIFSRLETNS
jgi:hypothetical protein